MSELQRSKSDRRQRKEEPPGGVDRRTSRSDRRRENNNEYVSFYLDKQLLGIPVNQVQEVLSPKPITKVPLVDDSITGLLNLRGQIVTAIDLRRKLDLPPRQNASEFMNVVVSLGNRGGGQANPGQGGAQSEFVAGDAELFSLLVDKAGDVLVVKKEDFEEPPVTLNECWKNICDGVYRLKEGLLVILNVEALIT